MEKERFKDVKVGDSIYMIDFDNFTISEFHLYDIKKVINSELITYKVYKIANNERIEDSFIIVPWMTRATSFKNHIFAVNRRVAENRLNKFKRDYIFLWKKNANNLQKQLNKLKEKINDLKEKEIKYEE